MTFFLLYWK